MTSTTKIRDYLSSFWLRVPTAWRIAVVGLLLTRGLFTLWSFVILNIFPVSLQNIDLFHEPVLTVFDLRASQGYVYSRAVNGEILTFEKVNGRLLRDNQTGSLWDFSRGEAVDGFLAGEKLQESQVSIEQVFPYMGVEASPSPLLAIWQHFDANWYLSIAQKGYGQFPDDTHFTPLYPLLVWFVHLVVSDWLIAGLLVSHVAVLFLIKTAYEIFSDWGGSQTAQDSLFLFLIFPSSFFLFSAYAEPLFILTTLLALRELHMRHWLRSGFWIACAVLARVQGVGLLLPLVYLLWKEHGLKIKVDHIKALIFPASAVLSYIALRIMAGAPSAIPVNEPSVGARMVWPWDNFLDAFRMIAAGSATYITIVNLVLTILFIGLLVFSWGKIPIEYNLYWLACILILVAREVETEPLNPMIRYALTIFPAFFIMAKFISNPWGKRLIVLISFLLGLFISAQFFLWGFVA